jgi:hypothetical protein
VEDQPFQQLRPAHLLWPTFPLRFPKPVPLQLLPPLASQPAIPVRPRAATSSRRIFHASCPRLWPARAGPPETGSGRCNSVAARRRLQPLTLARPPVGWPSYRTRRFPTRPDCKRRLLDAVKAVLLAFYPHPSCRLFTRLVISPPQGLYGAVVPESVRHPDSESGPGHAAPQRGKSDPAPPGSET